jgi:siderophore ferric iron reductase
MLTNLDNYLESIEDSTEKSTRKNARLSSEESSQLLFLQQLALFCPSLKLSLPPLDGIDTVVDALLSKLKHDHPEAGPVYWSNRCWALIYWQPIYIAVYSVHAHHSWISFSDFKLGFDSSQVSGFYFSSTHWLNKDHSIQEGNSLIKQQALELKVVLESFFQQLTASIKINTINAWRLVADCILMVLLKIEQLSDNQKIDMSYEWLKALGLCDRHGDPYSQLKTTYNTEIIYPKRCSPLGLDRKSCCMHFLIDVDNPCDTCNKRT